MDLNKEKCKTLKQIRKRMADVLDIDLHQTECTYEGTCSGTCPKCKQEEQQLNRALLGKTALAAGVVGMSLSLAGCTPNVGDLEGDTVIVTTEDTEDYLEGDTESSEALNSEDMNSEEEVSTENTEDMPEEGVLSIENTENTTEEFELEGDVIYIEED